VAEGDLIVSTIVAAGDRTITVDGTYTLVVNYLNNQVPDPDFRTVVCYKFAGASEGDPTHTISTSGSAWGAQNAVYRGVDPASPLDVSYVTSQEVATAVAEYTGSSITPVTSNAWVLSIVGTGPGLGSLPTTIKSGADQGFTARQSGSGYAYTTGVDMAFALADKLVASPASTTLPTWEHVGTSAFWGSIAVALRPESGAAFTMTPNGDGTLTNVVDEAGGSTNIYVSVDDDPDSPTTTDYVTPGAQTGSAFFDLSATPSDFGSVSSLSVKVHTVAIGFISDSAAVYAQVFASNESTNYTDEVSVGSSGTPGLANVAFTVNATGLAASKAAWDAARLRLRWTYTP
jgi:hypothetical protein